MSIRQGHKRREQDREGGGGVCYWTYFIWGSQKAEDLFYFLHGQG
jgi:hypothetical protein